MGEKKWKVSSGTKESDANMDVAQKKSHESTDEGEISKADSETVNKSGVDLKQKIQQSPTEASDKIVSVQGIEVAVRK